MAKADSVFVCQNCGAVHAKWAGRCDACGGWNSIVEETRDSPHAPSAKVSAKARGSRLEFADLAGSETPPPRFQTGVSEFDRVCGGGLVRGSALLVGGDPGIGKSTLLLQAVAGAAAHGASAAYVSGEESVGQIQDRARRLGLTGAAVALAAETRLANILDGLKAQKPDVVVVDSIQTMWSEELGAAPGSVTQVRACCHELVRYAKKSGAALVLVGHVTKDGQIAGPRVVEHMVDAVLQFEGERGHQFRILRGLKNRFGATDEIGVFEMGDSGLREVANPSSLFLDGRNGRATGAAVFAGMEGTRPVLVEIQALATPSTFGAPRRAVVGWDSTRLAMVLAVLEQRCGLGFGARDVYLNVAGGFKIAEPAADLAVAAALISAVLDVPLPEECVAFGEIALSGDVRAVSRADARLKEAEKLGFRRAFVPRGTVGGSGAIALSSLAKLSDLIDTISPDATVRETRRPKPRALEVAE
jgi:DNA repair protein RadA/Sms